MHAIGDFFYVCCLVSFTIILCYSKITVITSKVPKVLFCSETGSVDGEMAIAQFTKAICFSSSNDSEL